jgi:thioesterase domain-containing protein
VVLPIKDGGDRPPLWWFHPGGGLSWCYMGFAPHLSDERPSYGIQARGLQDGEQVAASVEEMVEDYLQQVRRVQPEGPYHLAGWSFGGTLAHAVACRLQKEGQEVGVLGLLDAAPSSLFASSKEIPEDDLRVMFEAYVGVSEYGQLVDRMTRIQSGHMALMRGFVSPVFHGDVLFFNATKDQRVSVAGMWRPLVRGEVRVHDIACSHHSMHLPEPARAICAVLNRELGDNREAGDR